MKHVFFALLLAFAVPAFATPVHVTLKASAAVPADAQGFFALGAVAQLSGGDAPVRERMASVPVGRVPLSGATRALTAGDVCLKLRQAGFRPETAVVLDGAAQASVTAASSPPVGARLAVPCSTSAGAEEQGTACRAPTVLIHSGDAVTILVQSGALSVTARGVARDAGRPGDTIRVHRDGVMTDLSVTVIDAQTVQLEM